MPVFTSTMNPAHIRRLADAFLECPIGQQVTYGSLSKVIGLSIQTRFYLLHAAMKLANQESGAIFRNVRLIGYERMPAENAHMVGQQGRHRIRRIARNSVAKMTNAIIKANDMSDAARLKAYSEQAALGLVQHMTYDRHMPVLKEGASPPPTAQTVRDTMQAILAHRNA